MVNLKMKKKRRWQHRHDVWKYHKKSHFSRSRNFFMNLEKMKHLKDENQWFETFSNSLQSEIIVNEKCSVLFVIICYHQHSPVVKNCCFNQKVLCNFLIRSRSRIVSLDLFQLWNWLDLFFFMGIFNFSTPYGWNHQFEGDLGLPTGMLEIVRHQISSDCLKK